MELHQRASELGNRGQISEAMALLQRGIDEGEGEAAFVLANWRFEGRLIRRDIAEARRLFRLSYDLQFTEAEGPLMALLASGAGGLPRDWTAAVSLLEKRACQDERSSEQLKLITKMEMNSEGEPLTIFMPNFISSDPLIVKFENFLSNEECDELIAMSASSLAPSLVVHPQTGELVYDKIRTSSAAAFPLLHERPFLHAINRRIADASRSQWEQGEPTQILHYTTDQEYKLHSDALPGGNQRIQTFLVYLTDDFGGGETYFPHGDHRIRLPKGHAICFSNVSNDMRPAKNAIHAGLPITHGEKIVLSKWIREQVLDLTGPPDKPF
ncbi:MAG: peptidyl prolyl 4-hydroxylase subunit alpha [Erythrobacter sp.]|nr:peptidyl prolyl 4-hydroxylase subunit alpha [Erythrobacter sp.]